MERQRIIIESPLSGDFITNRRYATWCCRYMHEAGYSPLASHLVAPWFMDDRDAEDRAAGIEMPWFWLPDVPHHFFIDFGMSSGMVAALQRCRAFGIPTLEDISLPARYLQSFQNGKWPPHTPGFGPEQEEDFDIQAGGLGLSLAEAVERYGEHVELPRGWCDPEHPSFDPAAFERALLEQEAYDRSLSPEVEARRTAELIESLQEVPPKRVPPESR